MVQLGLAMPIGHQAKIANFVQTLGQNMQAESAKELDCLKCLGAQLAPPFVVLKTEGHLTVLQRDQTMVGDGDAVGIASQIRQDVPRVLRLFGVDDPLLLAQRRQQAVPGPGFGEFPAATRQGQLALMVEVLQPVEVESPKAPREDPHGQEEVGPTGHPT